MDLWLSAGIDNGLFGAVVLIDNNYNLIKCWDTPIIDLGKGKKTKNEFLINEMTNIIMEIKSISERKEAQRVMVWIEKAQAMPNQGVSSTFKTGEGYGTWKGICAGLRLSFDLVSPRMWTKTVLTDIPLGDPKKRSMLKCSRLFPNLSLKKPRGKKDSLDGRADAALIAYYGMLRMLGKDDIKNVKKIMEERKRNAIW